MYSRHLREGLFKKCNIWISVDNNLGLANALSYHASHRVCDLWITLLFHLFFGTTSFETESRNRLLVRRLLADDVAFLLLHCISCMLGFLRCHLDKVSRRLEARCESLHTGTFQQFNGFFFIESS